MNGIVLNNISSAPFTTSSQKTLIYATTNNELIYSNNGTENRIITSLTSPIKYAVRVASTTNINLSSTLNSTSIDGVTVTVGDRVLLKDQTSGVQNGIYVVNSGLATRADDMINGKSISNFLITVNQGTQNIYSVWTCTNSIGSDVVGTNSLTFALNSTNNDIETLTSAGAISVSKETTLINDQTTYTYTNMPQYTLGTGTNGQRKTIISNGYVRVSASNLNNRGGQFTVYSGIPCNLVSSNGKWYNANDSVVVYPYVQQGSKYVGTGAVGTQPRQGSSSAISGDSNTVAWGADQDNSNTGAVWVFTRTDGVWTQQGSKLVPSDASAGTRVGRSIALSNDGNTLVVGGSFDGGSVGAAWAYTRSGGVWSQVGLKLVGTGAVGASQQGEAIAISGDGLTFAIGGPGDNTNVGAVWIYVYSAGTWSQQGSKLVPSDVTGAAAVYACSLSYDGNVLMVGGGSDNSSRGAIWLYTRTGTTWTQQGNKITSSPSATSSFFGSRVDITYDASTIIAGAYGQGTNVGAAYIFKRSINNLVQQAGYINGIGNVGAANFGNTIAISKLTGKVIAVAGYLDNSNGGAVWIFVTKDNGRTWNLVETKISNTAAGLTSPAEMGTGLGLSADGSTLIIGAWRDTTYTGANVIFS